MGVVDVIVGLGLIVSVIAEVVWLKPELVQVTVALYIVVTVIVPVARDDVVDPAAVQVPPPLVDFSQ